MQKPLDWVVLGQLGRAYGVRGGIWLRSFTEPAEQILDYKAWYLYRNANWEPIKRFKVDLFSKGIVIKLEGYDSPEAVSHLTHAKIGIKRTQLTKLAPGEFYCFELVGMDVFNTEHRLLGKVVDIMPTGANDVLVIEGERRHLLPYLPGRVIRDIDREKACMVVDWDEDF